MSESFPPRVKVLLDYFQYTHLPERLQTISKPFCELAYRVATGTLPGPDGKTPGGVDESVACLRKLLEAKDCAVRASL